jgi:hypothetical protein
MESYIFDESTGWPEPAHARLDNFEPIGDQQIETSMEDHEKSKCWKREKSTASVKNGRILNGQLFCVEWSERSLLFTSFAA